MPDWNYQTTARNVFKRLPYSLAQNLAFGMLGRLGRFALGRSIVRIMGHAVPPPESGVEKGDWHLPTAVMLGSGVDISAQATSALSLFGFGLIEVGPLSLARSRKEGSSQTIWREAGIAIPQHGHQTVDAVALAETLKKQAFRNGVPVILRIVCDESTSAEQFRNACRMFADVCDGVSLQGSIAEEFVDIARASFSRILMVRQFSLDDSAAAEPLPPAEIDGVVFELVDDSGRGLIPQDSDEIVTAIGRHVDDYIARSGNMDDQVLIAACGVQSPADALGVLETNVDLVMVDSGFADTGPGLPKRINAARRAAYLAETIASEKISDQTPVPERSWFWVFLMGFALTVGGFLALVIGSTRVVLPYDEEFLGMLRDEICGINDQLLPFMSHDRVTLSGTMLALGPLYLALAWFGDRRGMHWARVAILASSFVGFLSFFLFLGFGYFDPFHAFIAAVLFQFITLGLRSSQPENRLVEFETSNSPAWRRALWGQLLMIVHGGAILVGGMVISSFGITSVFVQTDLDFMQTTREALVLANPRLVPLVAHDRASFGGMLMSTGITVLLSALWGWQRGRRWLWYSLVGCGTVAYGTTIAIHWWVGYTDSMHLAPAYGGLVTLWLAMGLSRQWMFEDASVPDERVA